MLTDLLFADNPWWLGKEVPPPGRILPFSDVPGVQRFWVPVGGIRPSDLKGMASGWSKRWGNFSAFFLDLSRVEMPFNDVERALDFYFTRLHSDSERHLMIVNAAQWVSEELIKEFIDESYVVLLIYNVIPEREHRVFLPYYPDSPSPGDVREAFWEGDVTRARRLMEEYGRPLRRRVRSYFWKHVVGFPPQEKFYDMIRRMYSLIHEFYDVREKDLFRKTFHYLVSRSGQRMKFREAAESLDMRFETFRVFMDQIISVGLIYEFYHVNRENPRSPRIVFNSNGHFHHLLNHTDPKDVLMLDEDSPEVLTFLVPYVIGKAMERGVEVAFEDEEGRHLRFLTDRPFSVRLGEEVSFVELVGML